jgi:thiamine-phosphate pyrophosphorylase
VSTLSPLCAIVDVDSAERAGWTPLDLATAFLDGGATLLQLRAKTLPSGRFLELCDAVVALARRGNAAVIVNDRADLALLSGAAGVHVGQEDLPPAVVRRLLGDAAVIGFSTHTIVQVEAALDQPATYTAIGPVFGTRSKDTGYDPVGLELVAAAARRSGSRPVMAIGGITLENAAAARAAGAASVAVISDLLRNGSPSVRVGAFLRILA